jgi:hypothetical protein
LSGTGVTSNHFRLDDGKREVALVAQQVVDAAGRLADEALADRHDAPVSDRALLGDRVRVVVPTRSLKQRDDELAAGIGFGERHFLLGR